MRIMAPRKTTCVPMGKSFLRIAHRFTDLRISTRNVRPDGLQIAVIFWCPHPDM